MAKLAVLVSGTGSLLEVMLQEGLEISLVIADRKCRGIEIAEEWGVPIELIERTDFSKGFDRDGYTRRTVEVLQKHGIQFIAMAGYMTVFAPVLFDHFGGRILNTHPALLPAFKGHNAVKDALDSGVKVTGCTIHIATEELDAGPIITQEAVPVCPGDTVESLHERIKIVERRLYPQAIHTLMEKWISKATYLSH